jgi:uncharacterized membrane protein YgcG
MGILPMRSNPARHGQDAHATVSFRRRTSVKILVPALLAACLLPASAAEEIRSFASRIEVLPDSDIIVTETIRVMPEGDQIKRGIYRDFPTLYSGTFGLNSSVPFEILEVLRDGKREPSRTEQQSNGLRIYLGSADVLLPHQETTYTIKYRTGRQLGFFKSFDELYWNVTGNGWSFPILSASACVDLPRGAAPRSIEAFTGPKGGKGTAFEITGNCDVSIRTTKPLISGEGLTIVVTWPKGFVKAPAPSDQVLSAVSANRGVVIGAIGLLAAFGYFLVSWILVGRDPEHGVIIPLFAPPEGFTPQEVRYLDGLGTCDNTTLSAAVMHLAVQRALTITESHGKVYTLTKADASSLDDAETRLLEALFQGGSPLKLVQANHSTLTAARGVLAKDLAIQVGPCFARNTGVWVVGLLATLVPLGISLLDARNKEGILFMMVWLGIWSIGCGALSMSVFKAWHSRKKLAAIPITLFSIPFLAGWFFGMWMLMRFASPWVCSLYVAGLTLCVVFQHLLKRPTPEGQKLRDQILGFKKYLSVAEADRLGLENPPERTPQLFEKFLPYALALGVEQAWSEQFADVLAAASLDPGSGTSAMPLVLPLAAASSFTSSFNSAISSASTAPGSSSGSGGGGSSGGGGGGGGGGGW